MVLPQTDLSIQVTSPIDKVFIIIVVRNRLVDLWFLPQGRSSTPQPSSDAVPENSVVDDLLKQFAIVLVDIKAMTVQVSDLWRQEIEHALPELAVSQDMHVDPQGTHLPPSLLSKLTRMMQDALKEQLNSLNSIAEQVAKQVIQLLSRRACDSLLPVRSIPSQFRAMSSKRMPTEPSYFVPLILRPVKAFFGIGSSSVAGDRLRQGLLKESATEVFDSVCQR